MSVSRFLTFTNGLAILYCLLFLFMGFQIARIFYYRHKWRSFQTAFLVLCFFWALFRSIWFGFFVSDTTHFATSEILYRVAIPIQFATFSLLICYYAHIQHKEKAEWYTFKRRYSILWITTNAIFGGLEIVWISLGIKFHNQSSGSDPVWLNEIHSIYSGIVFLILAGIIGFYGWRVTRMLKTSSTQTKLLARLSFRKIVTVTVGLFICFSLRCAYDFVTSFCKALTIQIDSQTGMKDLLMFFVILIFEIVPTILVLVLFGHVKSTTLGALSKSKGKAFHSREANYTKVSQEGSFKGFPTNQLVRAELFNDPRRYDSDDENMPFRPSPTVNSYGTGSSGSSGSFGYGNQLRSINTDDIGT